MLNAIHKHTSGRLIFSNYLEDASSVLCMGQNMSNYRLQSAQRDLQKINMKIVLYIISYDYVDLILQSIHDYIYQTCSDQKIIITPAAATSPSIVGRHVRTPHEVNIDVTVVKERYTRATRECCGPSLCNTYLPREFTLYIFLYTCIH